MEDPAKTILNIQVSMSRCLTKIRYKLQQMHHGLNPIKKAVEKRGVKNFEKLTMMSNLFIVSIV